MLATSIAETSLTLDGVRIVVDSGLARRPRYDRAAGITRLVTERASQAAVTQRAGRSGRQGPGFVYRLWEEAATASLPRFDPPEIVEADLSALLLDCALWGVSDPRELSWLDPPPPPAWTRRDAGCFPRRAGRDGRPNAKRQGNRRLPLPPRLAHMLVEAMREAGTTAAGGGSAVERGLGGNRRRFSRPADAAGEGPRAEAAGLARGSQTHRHPGDAGLRSEKLSGSTKGPAFAGGRGGAGGGPSWPSFPDRLRSAGFLGGMDSPGARLPVDPHSPLAARPGWRWAK